MRADLLAGMAASTASALPSSPPQAGSTREVAQQFEALFIGMLLKSMRAASLGEAAGDSEAGRLYTSLLDQQLTTQISRQQPLGLAQILQAQIEKLSANAPAVAHPAQEDVIQAASRPDPLPAAQPESAKDGDYRQAFVGRLWSAAEKAGRAIGVNPRFLIAQAALESNWGRREIQHPDGRPSHNLFGIKATGWQGEVARTATTEYVHGQPQRTRADFRAYPNYEAAFADYAQLIRGSRRYQGVLGSQNSAETFAAALQSGGYATDPSYAAKLVAVINRLRTLPTAS